MSSEAFDRLLSRLAPEDRERIREMAIAYGLTFDDPSWVPFAITQMTLDELKEQLEDAAKAIGEAADLALRRIGNSARVVSNQAQTVIEAQADAVQNLREAILDIERGSAIEYRRLLAELADGQIGRLIDTGATGIVEDVTRHLTGEDGLLMRSATRHAAVLEEAQKRFVASVDAAVITVDEAARRAAASTRRGVQRTAALAMATITVYAALTAGLIVFWIDRQPVMDVQAPETSSAAQRPVRAPEHSAPRGKSRRQPDRP